jgi:two-component system invasion response regulator UvrY
MIDLLIADDHEIIRKGLRQIVVETPDIRVVDEAEDGLEVLDKIKTTRYDLIILDIDMPGKNGLDVLKQIKLENPHLPVLILSMYPEDQFAIRVLKAGASGYLTKRSASLELVEAIRRIASGRKYITAELAERLSDLITMEHQGLPHEMLSDREFQIMRLIAVGKNLTQIADDLYLSVKTVSTYRKRLLEKMDMNSNSEITQYVHNNGIGC